MFKCFNSAVVLLISTAPALLLLLMLLLLPPPLPPLIMPVLPCNIALTSTPYNESKNAQSTQQANDKVCSMARFIFRHRIAYDFSRSAQQAGRLQKSPASSAKLASPDSKSRVNYTQRATCCGIWRLSLHLLYLQPLHHIEYSRLHLLRLRFKHKPVAMTLLPLHQICFAGT